MTTSQLERHKADDSVCTEFTKDVETGDFGFVCPECGATNPLEGDPEAFKTRPFRCVECDFISLLSGAGIEDWQSPDTAEGEA